MYSKTTIYLKNLPLYRNMYKKLSSYYFAMLTFLTYFYKNSKK